MQDLALGAYSAAIERSGFPSAERRLIKIHYNSSMSSAIFLNDQ